MPNPWERNWGATPAAKPQAAPAQGNQWNDPAYLTQVYDWQRKSGQAAAAAQTYNHLLSLQADPTRGLIRDPATGQMVVMPGYNDARASTVAAETIARESIQDRYARERKDSENAFTREGQMNDATDKFNKDWTTSKIYDDYRKASQYRGAAEGALDRVRKDGNGAAAMQLLVSYVKSYDPNSVVNDGEREVIVSTASLPEGLQGLAQQVLTGGKMTGEQAERIFKELDGNFQGIQSQYELARNGQAAYLRSRGVKDVDVVLPQVGKRFDPYRSPAELAAEQEAQRAQAAMQAPTAAQPQPIPQAQEPSVPLGLLGGGAQQVQGGVPVGAGPAPAADGGVPNVSGPNDPAFQALPSGAKFNWNGKIKIKK